MTSAKISLGVLQRVSEFLADLPEDQLADLAEGRARLAYVRQGEDQPVPTKRKAQSRTTRTAPEPSEATKELAARLSALASREEVATHIKSVKGDDLKALGRALNVPNAGSLRVADLRLAIVNATVGLRLDSIATRGFDAARP